MCYFYRVIDQLKKNRYGGDIMKLQVLIADADPDFQRTMTQALSREGDMEAAGVSSDGLETLSLIQTTRPDVVLLDLGLPDIDGLQIIKSVREWTLLPIVVVSARAHERDKVEALDLGADDYITKPFGTAELLARVRAAI